MYIKSIFIGVVMKNSRFSGAAFICAVLSILTFPALATTISGAQVNVHVGSDSGNGLEWYPHQDAGLATISSEVEYPDYWSASHDIDEVSPESGMITFQTDNSFYSTSVSFGDCCLFSGFIYEFPTLNIVSASLSSTNQPDVINDSRVVLLSPTLIGIDAQGLTWGSYDPEPLIISVDFQTGVSIPPAVTYKIDDLGAIAGNSYGHSINGQGQVTGMTDTTGGGVFRAFLYEGGSMLDLGALDDLFSLGNGINNSGHITGESEYRAFHYDGNKMIDIGTLGGPFSSGQAINDSGHIVGYSTTAESYEHAFLYDGKSLHDLGTLGGIISSAFDINNNGYIVGSSRVDNSGDTHCFISDGINMYDIDTLGGRGCIAYSINENNQVTGRSHAADGIEHAFIYDGGIMHDLGTLAGDIASYGSDINNNGHVVGTSTKDGVYSAFLYDGNNMLDLCQLTDCILNGWSSLEWATSINDNGDITGYGEIFDGTIFRTHAFLITAVPTPPVMVTIDIKPSKRPLNIINLSRNKLLSVAIVGEESFDALQVDPTTVKFGPSQASPIRFKGHDYNQDSYSDLILIFKLNETGIACGDTEAILTGETFPEPLVAIQGTDRLITFECP